MLLYRTLLALSLLAVASPLLATARADGPPAPEQDAPVQPYPTAPAEPAAVPHGDLEAVFEGAKQALMFDRDRGEYVVVRVGDRFQGRAVTAIAADRVVLTEGASNYVLALPRRATTPVSPAPAPPTTAPAIALPPTAPVAIPAGPTLDQPVDPYAAAPGAVTVPAPVPAPPAAPPATVTDLSKPPTDASETPVSVPTDASETPVSAEPVEQRVVIPRADLDAALADFTALSQEIQLVREGERIRIKQLAKGTLLHRIGLRPGDLLVSVADKAIYDLDAAAQAYAVLKRADRFVIKLYRGDNRMKIHVQLKP